MNLRDESGQASVELLGLLPYLLLVGLVVWQLLLATWAVTSASNAARTGSRVQSRGGDGRQAALDALDAPLREHARSRISGERAEVRVRVPILVPGLDSGDLTVRRTAEFPRTS
jgi:hypothetical protein